MTLWRRKMQLLMTWGQRMWAWLLKEMNYLKELKHLSKRNLKTDHLTYKRPLKTKFWNKKDFLTSVQAESNLSFIQMTSFTSPHLLIVFKTHSLQQNNLASWACRQKTIKINCWTKLKCLMDWPKILLSKTAFCKNRWNANKTKTKRTSTQLTSSKPRSLSWNR